MDKKIEQWLKFYREVFSLSSGLEFSNFPHKVFSSLSTSQIIAAVNIDEVLAKCGNFLEVRTCRDLVICEESLTIDRAAKNGTYLIYTRGGIEADQKFSGMSGFAVWKKGIKGITLREHLLITLKTFWATEEHLDLKRITLCAGQHHPIDNFIPGTRWEEKSKILRIDGYHSGSIDDFGAQRKLAIREIFAL
jgi:hypothetical protein